MKKNFKEYVKKAVAVVAMAAAVVTVVPQVAEAGTPYETGCTVNPTGWHAYRFYCAGFDSLEILTHTYYARPIADRIADNPSTCTYKKANHSSMESCCYCGKVTGVWGTHCDNFFHLDCNIGTVDYGYCSELWNDVTIITQ